MPDNDGSRGPLTDLFQRVPTPAPLPPTPFITFRHPGYDDGKNILLRLPAFDKRGLHRGTAITLCGIIARNRWDGRLATTPNGPPVQGEDDDLLTEPVYFYHLGATDKPPYPVCPSFRHWPFPHDNLPPGWPQLHPTSSQVGPRTRTTTSVRAQDMLCLVTGYREFVQRAHLVPQTEWEWFAINRLRNYNHDTIVEGMAATDDVRNAVPLCVHIHMSFDDKAFGIVPKQGQWRTHYLTETRSLSRMHHNTTIQLDPIVSPAFVLARLAWAVLPFHAAVFYVDDPTKRVVTLRDPTTETWTADPLPSKDVIHRLLDEGAKGSKSANSRKRGREPSSLADSFGEEEGQATERTQEWIADQHHVRSLDTIWPIWSGERVRAAGLDLPSMDDRKERAFAPVIDQHRSKRAFTAEEARILARTASA